MNQVVLSGRLAADPTLPRETRNGHRKGFLLLAFAQQSAPPNDIGFGRITLFDAMCGELENLKKGSTLEVTGRVQYECFERNGVTHEGLGIVAESLTKPTSTEDIDFRLGRAASKLKESGEI